jgi:hypothetical protein
MDSLPHRGCNGLIVTSYGHGQCPLPRGRQNHIKWKSLPDPLLQAQTHQSSRCQNNGMPFGVGVELGKTGVNITPKVHHPGHRPQVKQLCPSPETAGRNDRAVGQIVPPHSGPTDERVTGVFPRTDRTDGDLRGKLGWKILERVHREIDSALDQSIVYLLGEDRAAAEASKRDFGGEIPGSLDLHSLGLIPGIPE